MSLQPARIGCSGWNYKSWRGPVYPEKGCPPSRWLEHYATLFDTVEVNSTFYRLASPTAVARWVEQTPPEFVFAAKASRYLIHMKKFTDMGQGVERFYASIAPLVESGKLGPVLWQLPERFQRDDDRLAHALDCLPPGRHCFEFRHPSWFVEEVYAMLRERGIALAYGHDPRRPWIELKLTTDWSLIRFHYGARGRRGNYSDAELDEWAERLNRLREKAELYIYFNNDWEAFAVHNALYLRARMGLTPRGGAAR
jgi:uncharacterized protein YecE (DUF72 family)